MTVGGSEPPPDTAAPSGVSCPGCSVHKQPKMTALHCVQCAVEAVASSTTTLSLFLLASFFEIADCFAFWSYFGLGRPAWTLAAETLSLIFFAFALTRVNTAFAGRAYAA